MDNPKKATDWYTSHILKVIENESREWFKTHKKDNGIKTCETTIE